MCWGSERGFRAPTSRTDWTPPTWWCLPLPQGLSTDSADGARHTPNSVSQDCGLPASHTELPGVWATLQQSTRETLAGCPMPPEPPRALLLGQGSPGTWEDGGRASCLGQTCLPGAQRAAGWARSEAGPQLGHRNTPMLTPEGQRSPPECPQAGAARSSCPA